MQFKLFSYVAKNFMDFRAILTFPIFWLSSQSNLLKQATFWIHVNRIHVSNIYFFKVKRWILITKPSRNEAIQFRTKSIKSRLINTAPYDYITGIGAFSSNLLSTFTKKIIKSIFVPCRNLCGMAGFPITKLLGLE